MSVDVLHLPYSENTHHLNQNSPGDANAIAKVLKKQHDLLYAFTVGVGQDEGPNRNFLWTLSRLSDREIGKLACWEVRGDRYSPRNKGVEFELETPTHSNEACDSDAEYAQSLGYFALTGEFFEGELSLEQDLQELVHNYREAR